MSVNFWLTVISKEPSCPLFVVTTTTPSLARGPYTAVADASFRIVMEAISSGRRRLKNTSPCSVSITTSSTTYRILLPPRIQILDVSPGAPERACEMIPATRPPKPSLTEVTGNLAIDSIFTVTAEAVNVLAF